MAEIARRAGGGTTFFEIPIIDMAPFLEGSAEGRIAVARAIGHACREIGFLSVINHGVPVALIDRVFAENRRFHALPRERKLAIDLRKSPNHRGYHPLGAEAVDPTARPDLKEAFDMALELPEDDPDVRAGKPLHGPNVWPADLPGFRATLEDYYAALIALGHRLCDCFAIDLGLPEGYFRDKHAKPLAQLRLLHYPPQRGPVEADAIGAGDHTDYGSVALLTQDDAGGLQVRNGAGAWIDVPPIHGAFICNVGDIMEIWTNGRYPATRHRVINRSGRDRYSQVLFFDPDFDCLVAPLPQCCGPDNPPRYQPVTMGRHLQTLFDATFGYRADPTTVP